MQRVQNNNNNINEQLVSYTKRNPSSEDLDLYKSNIYYVNRNNQHLQESVL